MSVSLLGVFVLNFLFLVTGSCLLWAIRGWSSWGEYVRLGGIAYVIGLSSVCVPVTVVLVYGGGGGAGTILALVAGIGLAGLVTGVVLHRRLPPAPRLPELPQTPAGWLPVGAAALIGGILVAFFREARSQPLTSWDAWTFWMTKAKAIYFFGGLDPQYFRMLWGPTYPLLVPTLAEMNFRFMGTADTTTLGVQWWLLAVGFVWAAAGLLRSLAPAPVIAVFLLSALLIPELDKRLLARTADWPLDLLFGVAVLALLGWILTAERWRLWVFGVTLAAVIATKREGLLLAVCVVVAAVAALGWRQRRRWAWPVGAAVAAYAVNLPWQFWWMSRHYGPQDAAPGGTLHATFANIGKAGAAFDLVVGMLFRYDMWLGVVPIAIVAALFGLVLADRRPAVFFLTALVLGIAGWTWENWTWSQALPISSVPALNPTSRTVGSLVVLAVVTAPVVIGKMLAVRRPTELGAAVPAVT